MENSPDTYQTITKPSKEVVYKEKNSKFLGYAFPVTSEEEIKLHLDELRKKHHAARHWCYAWQLGKEETQYRANDDGEPSNSAGMPIYGQIQSFRLTNVLVVVVRYYGGVKLGVGGLIQAYKTAANMALENSRIVERTIDTRYKISFEYPQMNRVMRIIKENNLQVVDQNFEISCEIILSVRKGEAGAIFSKFDRNFKIAIEELED